MNFVVMNRAARLSCQLSPRRFRPPIEAFWYPAASGFAAESSAIRGRQRPPVGLGPYDYEDAYYVTAMHTLDALMPQVESAAGGDRRALA